MLAPQAASALSFNFSFGGVTGLITGLAEGSNFCDGTVCIVSVQNVGGAIGTPTGPYSGNGLFQVQTSGGAANIVLANWNGRSGNGSLEFFDGSRGRLSTNSEPFLQDDGVATFTPAPSAVPGPLPVLGAAAAFGYSRKLRKRVKNSSKTGSTGPFV
ncbi:hypothetical protein [Synechococcus sp. CS-1332]|uniref:hypothetical protein n=1 Tax=Synechococcus sp. CS-1332 TaxID=2847972 RepID=UPI00223C081D|nr:hypothetical protein [Synechococcus sp. CS-1332]MCT0208012.1 hypothetical protein [Synechococcus sp. CS-1332]